MNKKIAATLLGALIGAYGMVPACWADDAGLGLGGFPSESSEPFESTRSGSSPAPSGSSGFAASPTTAAAPALQEEIPTLAPDAVPSASAASGGEDLGLAPDVSPQPAAPAPPVTAAPRSASVASPNPQPAPVRVSTTPRTASSGVKTYPSARANSARASVPVRKSKGGGSGHMISRFMGAMVSAPGSIARESMSEWKAGVQDMTNGSSNPCMVIPSALICVPFCATAGVVEGLHKALHGDADASRAAAAPGPSSRTSRMAELSKDEL